MKSTKLLTGVLAAGVLAFAGTANAQWDNSGSQPGSQGQQGSQAQMQGQQAEVTGVVKSVDKTQRTITLQLPVSASATIERDGSHSSLDQIKEGDDVRAAFDPSTDKLVDVKAESKGAKSQQQQGQQPGQQPGGSQGGGMQQ